MCLNSVGPSGTGYVEVSPFCFVDELLNEHRSHDRSRLAAGADVLDIGDVGLDLFAVFRPDWQLPKTLACITSTFNDPVDERLIIPHDPGVDVAEGDDHGTGERCHVHDAGRTLLL